MKRIALLSAVLLVASAFGASAYDEDEGPSGYLTLGMFNPGQNTYENGWEIGAVALPDREKSAGFRFGLGISFFDTAGYQVTQSIVVPPGDQVQFLIDIGYGVQFGGEETKSSYAAAGLSFVAGSWDGPQGSVDDDAIGWHVVIGTRLSERFLVEAEWLDAQFGRAFANEEAGGLIIRAGYGF